MRKKLKKAKITFKNVIPFTSHEKNRPNQDLKNMLQLQYLYITRHYEYL